MVVPLSSSCLAFNVVVVSVSVVVVVGVTVPVVLVAVVEVAVVEPVYVVVVDVEVVVVVVPVVVVVVVDVVVVVVFVTLVVVRVAVEVVAVAVVRVVVVRVVVVVSMQLRSRCFTIGWCWPSGHSGHILCVLSLGMYCVSCGHGSCVSHVYAFAVGVVGPPQLPALYSCRSSEHCVFLHALHVKPLFVASQVPLRYSPSAQIAFSHAAHSSLFVDPPQLPTLYCCVLHVNVLHQLHVMTLLEVEYAPDRHAVQAPCALALAPFQYDPGLQPLLVKHCLLFVDPPQLPTWYCGGGHPVNLGHAEHCRASAVLEYVPDGHAVQVPCVVVLAPFQ